MTYSAISAEEFGIGGGVNGSGKRQKIKGAYTIDQTGRKVRAFRDSEGGITAAQKWAETLNQRQQ